MALDMFITIIKKQGGKILGESAGEGQDGAIKVLSWSWGATYSGPPHQTPGGSSGNVHVQDIHLTKYVDSSTPKLLECLVDSADIERCTLVVQSKAGKKPVEYVKIDMVDCRITHISNGGHGEGGQLHENITINFKKYTYQHTPTTKGGAGGNLSFGWDIEENKEL